VHLNSQLYSQVIDKAKEVARDKHLIVFCSAVRNKEEKFYNADTWWMTSHRQPESLELSVGIFMFRLSRLDQRQVI